MPENKTLPFPMLEEPVMIQIPRRQGSQYIADGEHFSLQYPLATLRRLATRLGMPMIGRHGSLLDVHETNLPDLIYEGLCDPETGEPPKRRDGAAVTFEDVVALPASALQYLITSFTTAYNQSVPEKKVETPPAPAASRPN